MKMFWLSVILTVIAGTSEPAAQAQQRVPALQPVPQHLPDVPRGALERRYAPLAARRDDLRTRIGWHDTHCLNIAASDPNAKTCDQVGPPLVTAKTAYIDDVNRFNDDVSLAIVGDYFTHMDRARSQEPPRVTRAADRMFIGGTGWVYAYVRRDDERLEEAARRYLEQEKKLLGVSGTPSINVKDYDMIMGIASNDDFVFDLLGRVVGYPRASSDQSTAGGFSKEAQPLYASLKGTKTSHLDCHSNGAMICLTALEDRDVTALANHLDVRLFGPQVTAAALERWQTLLRKGTINTLEINIMEGDPVGPASFAIGDSPWLGIARRLAEGLGKPLGTGVRQLNFFAPDAARGLKTDIERYAPAARVKVLSDPSCRQGKMMACHDAARYLATAERSQPQIRQR